MNKSSQILNDFINQIKTNRYWKLGEPVVVAVSTGVDSMVLLNLLTKLPSSCKPQIIVAHVNHKLREQSEEEQLFIKNYCAKHNLTFELSIWDKQQHPKAGIEAAGRKFRYEFFRNVMKKYNSKVLMTAHHANDQAETVLMKLIRGNYIASLSGIDVERNFYQGHLVRPLLNFDKPSIKQFAIDNQITWFEDATNKDLNVQRNRFRNVILPIMQQENKNAVEHIGQFTSELSDLKNTNEFLLRQNLNIISDDEGNVTISKFLLYPNYVQKSLIAYLIFSVKKINGLKPKIVSEILNLLHNSRKPQAKINLINNTYLVKNYNVFRIECISDKNIDEVSKPFKLLINKWYKSVNGFSFGIFDDKFKFENVGSIDRQSTFYLSDKQLPLVVRQTNKNDKITLKSGGHQSAKRIFINKKILSIFRKRAQTLLTSDEKVLSIIGYSESTILNYSDKRYTLVVKGINLKGEEHE